MEDYEAFIGFDLYETALSSVAQKILSAMRSGDLVDSKNWEESTKTTKVTAKDKKNQPLETKNPNSLTSRASRGPIKLSSQSVTQLTGQMSADQVWKSVTSLAPCSSLIPQCNQKTSVLQQMEQKRKHCLKENMNNEHEQSMNLKRKNITCSSSPETTSKHMPLEKDSCEDDTCLNSEDSRAFRNQLCDVRYLDDLSKLQLMEVLNQAAGLVVTLLYKDGSTQLRDNQARTSSVKGIVMLLKSHIEEDSSSLSSPTCGGALEKNFNSTDRYIYIQTEHFFLWDQEQVAQHLFARRMLLQTLKCKCPVICFNAKNFVKAVLQFLGDDHGNWKQVADFVGLDPRIAAWLIDPSDAIPSFEDLVAKYLGKSIVDKTRSTCGNISQSIVNQNVCVNLKILYSLMMDLCSKLKVYGLWQLFCTLELPLIPILAVMENHKIQVNQEEMEKISALLGARLKELEQEAHFVAGEQFLITSNNQLREVLFGKLKLHLRNQRMHLPRTGLHQQPSTSEAVLNSLQDLHPLPKIILEYRQVHKIKSTFIDGLLACMKKGSVSSTWNQTGTVTGRLSAKHPHCFGDLSMLTKTTLIHSSWWLTVCHCTNIHHFQLLTIKKQSCEEKNIQGISKHPIQISKPQTFKGKEEETVTISPRALFVSSKGHTFLAADFSQIELRILAHLSGDPELLKLFQESDRVDVFSTLTSQWKNIPVKHVTHADREQTKKVVYSVVYGAGKERLAACLGVTVQEATRFLEMFLQKYKKIKDFAHTIIAQCHHAGYVTSIMGRRRPLPRICAQNQQLRAQAERQAVNFVVQGSAADLCKMAMIRIFAAVATSPTLTARLVAQIHDELLFEVEDTQVSEFAALVRGIMESLQQVQTLELQLQVPLKVNLSAGPSWGDLAPLQEAPNSA